MNLTSYVVIDPGTGTFFDAKCAYLIDTNKLSADELELLNEGSDSDRADLVEDHGIDLEESTFIEGCDALVEARRDANALDRIQQLLDRQAWTVDALDDIAAVLRNTNRDVCDVCDF